jgi:hypothetical protein
VHRLDASISRVQQPKQVGDKTACKSKHNHENTYHQNSQN